MHCSSVAKVATELDQAMSPDLCIVPYCRVDKHDQNLLLSSENLNDYFTALGEISIF